MCNQLKHPDFRLIERIGLARVDAYDTYRLALTDKWKRG